VIFIILLPTINKQLYLCKFINLKTKNMKTILVLTDFSDHAKHAAEYAFKLAKKIKANVLLCNTFLVPAEIPMAGLSVWPQDEYGILSEGSAAELDQLKEYLQTQTDAEPDTSGFYPHITTSSTSGSIGEMVKELSSRADIQLVVAGTHDKAGLNDLLLGNNADKIIDHLNFPLLLVPPSAAYQPLNKIAFAADLVNVSRDEDALYQLVKLARLLNAEILVTHIYNEKNNKLDFEKQIKALLTNISNKADYTNIYSRILDDENPEKGLNWICENGHIDMLAMVYQHHSFFEKLFTTSHTQKMARHIAIPLLVLPNQF
jgi:nucleotide-binding universal stress UspA family protein